VLLLLAWLQYSFGCIAGQDDEGAQAADEVLSAGIEMVRAVVDPSGISADSHRKTADNEDAGSFLLLGTTLRASLRSQESANRVAEMPVNMGIAAAESMNELKLTSPAEVSCLVCMERLYAARVELAATACNRAKSFSGRQGGVLSARGRLKQGLLEGLRNFPLSR
jgi:hypothetical protein